MASSRGERRQSDDDETSTLAIPTALGGATGDYRDGQEYLPTGFGEIGQYLRNKRRKLQVQNRALLEDGTEYAQIFHGLHIYINGYTESIGLTELQELLIRHGGVYVPYLDRKALVTHIVATNLTPTKRKEFAAYKVAIPAWLVDSAREGKLLDWRMYSLLAPDQHDSPKKTGWEEERDRMGTQTGQKNLFSMLSSANKKEPRAAAAPTVRTTRTLPLLASTSKPVVETIESLSQRGARLARAVVLEQQQAATGSIQSFLQPPLQSRRNLAPAPASNAAGPVREDLPSEPPDTSSTTTSSENLAATTDSPHAPGPIKHSWLPQKERDSRTTALVNDPEWRSKHTSASEDFLQGYFAQSRLHHLSSFKEELKVLVAARQAGNESLPARAKKLTGTAVDGRTIFHVDFDCFFVSAGLTTREELRGKPVAVCHARGLGDSLSSTSEIASCSYEARKFQVKNGMSLGRARELCPEIQTMPFEFERYREFSLKFYDILLSHADLLQAVSMDEVLFEVKLGPTVSRDKDPALELAHRIRAEIFEATGCPASIGISHNILLARLATRRAKPASAYHLLPEEVENFLEPLHVDSLPGIGWSLRKKLADELDVSTVGQLRRVPPKLLKAAIGDGNGKKFGLFTRGIDDSELEVDKARKSVSAEVNYGIRFEEGRIDQVERFVRELATEVARRLRQEGLKAGSLLLKVMVRHPDAPVDTPKLLGHGWVDTHNRQSALQGDPRKPGPIDDPTLIADVAWKLMHSLDAPPHELRGIGITLQKLDKDGHSVDIVREKGQATLSFASASSRGATRADVSDRSKSASSSREASVLPKVAVPSRATTVAAATTSTSTSTSISPEVIVLDDSDSEPETKRVAAKPPPAPAPVRSTRLRSRSRRPDAAAEVYIPQLFYVAKARGGGKGGTCGSGGGGGGGPLATASQVSDAELVHYGIDVEVYRSIGPEDQRDALVDARRRKPPRFVASANKEDKKEKKNPNEASDVVILDSTPPGDDETIAGGRDGTAGEFERQMDHLPAEVRAVLPALGVASQRDLLRRCVAGNMFATSRRREVGRAGSRDGGGAGGTAATRGTVLDVAIRTEPRFAKLSDAGEIEDRIERWVLDGRESPLHEDDVDRFGTFLERLVSRDNGHALSKAVELLKWWRTLLEDEFGHRHDDEGQAQTPQGRAWWEGFDRTVQRVEYVVKKETLGRLIL